VGCRILSGGRVGCGGPGMAGSIFCSLVSGWPSGPVWVAVPTVTVSGVDGGGDVPTSRPSSVRTTNGARAIGARRRGHRRGLSIKVIVLPPSPILPLRPALDEISLSRLTDGGWGFMPRCFRTLMCGAAGYVHHLDGHLHHMERLSAIRTVRHRQHPRSHPPQRHRRKSDIDQGPPPRCDAMVRRADVSQPQRHPRRRRGLPRSEPSWQAEDAFHRVQRVLDQVVEVPGLVGVGRPGCVCVDSRGDSCGDGGQV